ncbi:MAG: hypothetical protein ACLUEU_10825 [Oscillospiraceae bacterium]
MARRQCDRRSGRLCERESREVSIDSSFAASVLRGTTAAGGLIGQADSAL